MARPAGFDGLSPDLKSLPKISAVSGVCRKLRSRMLYGRAPSAGQGITPSQARAIADAIQRRHDRHMPGNPFPPDSPWGRELDRMYAENRAAERFRRHREAAAVREAGRAGQGVRP